MTNLLDQLTTIRAQIKVLEDTEAGIVATIIATTGHDKLGQATYDFEGKQVEIKTGENVRLDKNLLNTVWTEKMPINRSYAYTLRTKDYEAIMKSGTPAQKKVLSEIVTTSPAKAVVKIKG